MKLGKRLLAVTTAVLLIVAATTSVTLVGPDSSGTVDGNPLLWHSDGDVEAGLVPGHNWQSAGRDVRIADGHNWQSVPVAPGDEDSGGSTWDGGTEDDGEAGPAGETGTTGA